MRNSIAIPLLFSITTLPLILRYILKKRYKKLILNVKEHDDKSYYECIFFSYKSFYCKPHLIYRKECGEDCSYMRLERLLHYIASAKKSISMCIYMVTLKQITNELVNANRRGVTVRVITDKVMGKATSSEHNLIYLGKWGIPYKTPSSSDEMMHHKYCLIDEDDRQGAKVFFGSLNLTAQAFCKNFEAIILTNNQTIIQRLSDEFEDLWKQF